MFNLLPLIKSALTIGFSFLLLIISAIISSKQLIFYVFFPKLYSAIFLQTSSTPFECAINAIVSS